MEGYGNENPGAFQPTRPLRGATSFIVTTPQTTEFQPTRPLRGATYLGVISASVDEIFQPTRPLRGATRRALRSRSRFQHFNPRAPCGARLLKCGIIFSASNFNPRAPCGARLIHTLHDLICIDISTHAPLAGRDPRRSMTAALAWHFNPRAPCGARRLLYRRLPPV